MADDRKPLNPRVKISKTGRPYVEAKDLIAGLLKKPEPLDTWSVEEAEGLANAAFDKMGIAEWRAMVYGIAAALQRERSSAGTRSTQSNE